MAHDHIVLDDDKRYVIDPVTRLVTNKAGSRTKLIQYDHNSEEITFEIPKVIENHDMAKVDKITVYFENVGTGTSVSNRMTAPGSYEIPMDKVIEDPDNTENLLFTWLVSRDATQYYGTVKFALTFQCNGGEKLPDYQWGTEIIENIDIKPGMNSNASMPEHYPDAFTKILQEVATFQETVNQLSKEVATWAPGSGENGTNGATFTPSVDEDGNLSWTNDGALDNPATVNIMGPQGPAGKDGVDGETPQKGIHYGTPEDVQTIANVVLQSLPNGDEVSY